MLLLVSFGCSSAEEEPTPSCETACGYIAERCGPHTEASCVTGCKQTQIDAAAKGCSGAYDLAENCCSAPIPVGSISCGGFSISCKAACPAEWTALEQCSGGGSGGTGGSSGGTSGGGSGGTSGAPAHKCEGAGPTYFTQEGLPCGQNPVALPKCTLKQGGVNYSCDGKTCTWRLHNDCQCCCPGKPCTNSCSKEGGIACNSCAFC